ncbi:MAG: hypothetical protein KBB91_01560 [Candidatus Pacebacteria bacterium]|jgi:O-antigen/teichoic acid export membrane protein|nr:hypothetical protein [Candidatus Paceibacterota bacterium]MBP9700892.1 hypothetical protein [Candidatus Paceibacterota bacterium]
MVKNIRIFVIILSIICAIAMLIGLYILEIDIKVAKVWLWAGYIGICVSAVIAFLLGFFSKKK